MMSMSCDGLPATFIVGDLQKLKGCTPIMLAEATGAAVSIGCNEPYYVCEQSTHSNLGARSNDEALPSGHRAILLTAVDGPAQDESQSSSGYEVHSLCTGANSVTNMHNSQKYIMLPVMECSDEVDVSSDKGHPVDASMVVVREPKLQQDIRQVEFGKTSGESGGAKGEILYVAGEDPARFACEVIPGKGIVVVKDALCEKPEGEQCMILNNSASIRSCRLPAEAVLRPSGARRGSMSCLDDVTPAPSGMISSHGFLESIVPKNAPTYHQVVELADSSVLLPHRSLPHGAKIHEKGKLLPLPQHLSCSRAQERRPHSVAESVQPFPISSTLSNGSERRQHPAASGHLFVPGSSSFSRTSRHKRLKLPAPLRAFKSSSSGGGSILSGKVVIEEVADQGSELKSSILCCDEGRKRVHVGKVIQ